MKILLGIIIGILLTASYMSYAYQVTAVVPENPCQIK